MFRFALRVMLLAASFAAATIALGWWTVPLLGAAWPIIDRDDIGAPRTAALAAILGWGALLTWDATYPPFGLLGRRLAGVFGPPAVLLVATLLLVAALAWGAATVVSGILDSTRRRG
jgi:hypothetical protein